MSFTDSRLKFSMLLSVMSIIGFLGSCTNKKEKDYRKEAAHILNSIDSLTDAVGPPGKNLVRYFKEVSVIAKSKPDHKLDEDQIDSLNIYYQSLTSGYENALRIMPLTNHFKEGNILINNFLTLMKKGREPWQTVIPVYLKVFKEGANSANPNEMKIIDSTSDIFLSSGEEVLRWSEFVGEEMEKMEKKYRLVYSDSLYR